MHKILGSSVVSSRLWMKVFLCRDFLLVNFMEFFMFLFLLPFINICDRLCENQTCREKIGTTIQANIGGQYKFVDLLIIDSLVSLDIVLSICEVSVNLTNAFTPKLCSENFTSIRNTAKIGLRHHFYLKRHS